MRGAWHDRRGAWRRGASRHPRPRRSAGARGPAGGPRLHGPRPDRPPGGRGPGPRRVARRPAPRLGRHPGAGQLPAAAAGRRGALRVRRGRDQLEVRAVPVPRARVVGQPHARRRFLHPRRGGQRWPGRPAVRRPRHPRLRPARGRHPRPGAAGTGPSRRALRRPAQGRLPRHRLLLRPQRHLLLRLHGHRAPRGRGLRPRADRAARRQHTFLARAGTERGAEVLEQLGSRPAEVRDVRAADTVVERSTQRMGRTMDTTDIRALLYENAEHPRWDDVAEPVPVLRQLHDGLPHLLLHVDRGPHLPVGRADRALADLGLLLHLRLLLPARRQRPEQHEVPLPAVDDPQAGVVDRPVRHLRLRRLRAVPHLVPGRHRHHRGGGRDPCRPAAAPGQGERG